MLLDFTAPWGIIARNDPPLPGGPEEYAAYELSSLLGRMTGSAPLRSDASRLSRFFVLDSGSPSRVLGGRRRGPRWSWRASEDRVELWGEDGGALLAAVYAFLRALGAEWVAPGSAGERLPRGARLGLSAAEGASPKDGPALCLALAHGAFLEDWEAQLAWAARSGYSSVCIHTSRESLALEAAPYALYDSIKPELAAFARKAGLGIELAGEIPWPVPPDVPATLGGSTEERAEETAARLAQAHPEVSVFHAWPESLPGGGWRGAPARAEAPSAAIRLEEARLLSEALARARPGAALSFLARPEDGDASATAAAILGAGGGLPPGLELLWAPRRRSYARPLSDAACRANASVLESFERTAEAWKKAGGGRIAIIERWEDGLLFGGAVPPLTAVIEGDLAAYRTAGADAICLLRGGCRLPAAPRPNAFAMPRLAGYRDGPVGAGSAPGSGAVLADWVRAAYGGAAEPMLDYWRELEKAWAISLDIEEGDCEPRDSGEGIGIAREAPADWGDPRASGAARLAARRDRCEELFDHLRAAEKALSEARAAASPAGAPGLGADSAGGADSAASADGADRIAAAAVAAESDEYAVSGTRLELECARLSAYYELAAGDERAAADIANLALSVSSAYKAALGRSPDRRSRRESVFLAEALVDLGLRSIRRLNARSGLRRTLELRFRSAAISLSAAGLRKAFEGRRE